ncbi:MAG TPA: polysaccharide deacetylase family protein [Candidatus Polarisedimenticolaceae bacterium]|nr:polysaccharide deacetylase family protein [Candidatus Polarisedimenticolaceae bacterium]
MTKALIAAALYRTGAHRLVASWLGLARMPLIIAYHRVVEDFAEAARGSLPAMLVSVRTLERQLDWLARHFELISLEEIGPRLERGGRRKPPCAITFDDGYADVYTHALPLLLRKGIPAGIFVVTDLVGTRGLHAHDRLFLALSRAFARGAAPLPGLERMLGELGLDPPEAAGLARAADSASAGTPLLLDALRRDQVRALLEFLEGRYGRVASDHDGQQPMSWPMLETLSRAGFTIGSHTREHALLTNEDGATMVHETLGSRLALEARLGVPIEHFAYPRGCFDAEAAAATAAAGYRYGYTTCLHRDATYPRLTIPRSVFWEGTCVDAAGRFSAELMGCQVHGVFAFRNQCLHRRRTAASAPPLLRAGSAR